MSYLFVISLNSTIAEGNWAVFFLCWVISACIIGAIEATTEVYASTLFPLLFREHFMF